MNLGMGRGVPLDGTAHPFGRRGVEREGAVLIVDYGENLFTSNINVADPLMMKYLTRFGG